MYQIVLNHRYGRQNKNYEFESISEHAITPPRYRPVQCNAYHNVTLFQYDNCTFDTDAEQQMSFLTNVDGKRKHVFLLRPIRGEKNKYGVRNEEKS